MKIFSSNAGFGASPGGPIGVAAVVALIAAMQLCAAQADAQPTPTPPSKDDDVLTMDAFAVTGSNIKRVDAETILPVTVMTADDMNLRDYDTPIELLTAMPQVTSMPINETTQGSAGARGDVGAINLRGIGSSNSLILLDGRRLASDPSSGAASYAVNVNQLPTQGIARIEVLRDSASSIYGSDAVAGVVNYIMRDDFRGTELKVRYGVPEEGGGQTIDSTLTLGRDFANGKGRILTTIDFFYRDAIFLSDRSFTASADHTAQAPAPFNIEGSGMDGRGTVGNWPTYEIGSGTATNYFYPLSAAPGTPPSLTAIAPTRAASPQYYSNLNEYFIGSPLIHRGDMFSKIEYDLTDRISAFSDLSYYHSDATTQRQPISITAPTVDVPDIMAVDNPYNPYGSRYYDVNGAPNADGTPRIKGTPRTITLLSEFVKDLPPDKTIVDANSYRMVGGLRGKIGGTWTWETAGLFSRYDVTDHSPFYVRASLLQAALLNTTTTTAFNPFGYTFKVVGNTVVPDQVYQNPSSVMDTFITHFRRDSQSEIGSGDFRASGELFNLWSGPVSLAFGGEIRHEEFSDLRPPFISLNPPGSGLDPTKNDVLQFPPAPNSAGERTVYSVYSEGVVPLVAAQNHIPLVERLEFTASVRFEDFSDVGTSTKPKIGLNWKPVDFLMLRASYSEGFTAPSFPYLYAPFQYNTSGGSGTVDPYRNPITNEGGYAIRTITSGNKALKPADSVAKSAGAVLDVPGVKGLSISADYWEISRTNVIGTRATSEILATDASLLAAYTQKELAAGVPIGQINLGSGTADYKGDPAVVRNPTSAADIATFAAYDAAHPSSLAAPVGDIFSLYEPYLNLAEDFASGWDLSLNYSLPEFSFGRISFDSDWAYLRRSYTLTIPPNSAPIFSDRMNVGGASRWRGTSDIVWHQANWSAGVSAYYIGSFADTGATTTQAVWQSLGKPSYIVRQFTGGTYVYEYRVHDQTTYNAFAQYRFGPNRRSWMKNTTVRLGVINLLNQAPPLGSGAVGYPTSVYDTLAGRTWTIELTKDI